jgi:hypothetical protein
MTTIKRNDKDGWRQGAGPYSRSYPKKPADARPAYSYLNSPPRAWAKYVVSDKQTSQSRIAGTDISDRVFSTGNRNYGLSAPVSGNKRPSHKAESSARGSGIDPSTPRFVKHKDYR